MSLDVSLIHKTPITKQGTGVFVREDGARRELTPEEVAAKWPAAEAVPSYSYETREVYDGNVTHNLGAMAREAGIYIALWRPDERGWEYAHDILPVLEAGLEDLKARPEHYKKFNPDNGWGTYEGLVEFVEAYTTACHEYPDAKIEVSR